MKTDTLTYEEIIVKTILRIHAYKNILGPDKTIVKPSVWRLNQMILNRRNQSMEEAATDYLLKICTHDLSFSNGFCDFSDAAKFLRKHNI